MVDEQAWEIVDRQCLVLRKSDLAFSVGSRWKDDWMMGEIEGARFLSCAEEWDHSSRFQLGCDLAWPRGWLERTK